MGERREVSGTAEAQDASSNTLYRLVQGMDLRDPTRRDEASVSGSLTHEDEPGRLLAVDAAQHLHQPVVLHAALTQVYRSDTRETCQQSSAYALKPLVSSPSGVGG